MAVVFNSLGASLYIDEPYSANVAALPWREFLKTFEQDPATPLYYVLLKFWVSLFGDSERALRSFSTLCFALTVAVVAVTAKGLGGPYAGIAAAVLASVSHIGLVFAGIARPYALLSLLTATGTLLFFYGMEWIEDTSMSREKNRLLLAGLVAVDVLGLLTHPIFVFFMLGCNLVALLKSRSFFWTISVCNLLAAGLFLAVWGGFLFRTIGLPAVSWMEVPDLKDLAHAFLNLWGVRKSIVLAAFLLLGSLLNFRPTRDFLLSRPGLAGLGLLGMMSVFPFLISQYKVVFIDSRTPTLFFPLASVMAALLMVRFERKWLTFGMLAVLFGYVVVTSALVGSPAAEHSPRSSIGSVLADAKCGDVLISGGLSNNEITYYLRRLEAPACIQDMVFPESMNHHPGWMDPQGLMAHSTELGKEAELLVHDLEQDLEPQGRVWFFYESGRERQQVLDILKSRLDREMILVESMDGYGSFFDVILVYASRE